MQKITLLMLLAAVNLHSSEPKSDPIEYVQTSDIVYIEDTKKPNDLFLDTDHPELTELIVVRIRSDLEG